MAKYQKGIILCLLLYVIAVVSQFVVPAELLLSVAIGLLVVGVAATVFVFLLATKVYRTGFGIVLGILCLVPLVGLVILLIVNGKATAILKANGIHVGLLGADLSQV